MSTPGPLCPRYLPAPPRPCVLLAGHPGPCSSTKPETGRPRYLEEDWPPADLGGAWDGSRVVSDADPGL